MSVGSTNQPLRQRPGTSARLPPVRTRPPSLRATSMQPITFSKCCGDTSAPWSVDGSNGSPTLSARVRSTSAALKRS
jgi:hypothetical protein